MIGEVAETTSGGTPSRKRLEYYGGAIPWLKSGELEDRIITAVEEFITEDGLKNSSAKLFPTGTPLVALYGATVGKTGILGIDAATNQAICAIFALENAFTPEFIFYWLQFQRHELIELSTGGAQPNISQRIIRAFPFPLAPLLEQRRIVAAIETQFTRLEAGVATLKRAQANLKRYKAAVLKAACEGRLVPTEAELARAEARGYEPADALLARILAERRARWEAERWEYEIERAQKKAAQARRKAAGLPHYIRDLNPEDWQDIPEEEYAPYLPNSDKWKQKYNEPEPPDTRDLPELPEGWVWATVEQCIKIIDYRGRTPPYSGKGIPHLRSSNIRSGQVAWNDLRYVTEETYQKYMTRGLPQRGDLLFTTEAPLGEVAFAPEKRFSLAQRMMILRPEKGFLSPGFLKYQIMSTDFQQLIRYRETGSTVTGISSRNFRPIPLRVPPIAEQHRIVAEVERRLSVVGELEKQVDAALRRAERLRQAVLKRAFQGRLVPQDPADEPASALLVRIHSSRKAAKPPRQQTFAPLRLGEI
jgi:type I restriction enzyme S subunit